MTQHTAIKIFEEKRVRTVWDDQQEKWYFCINNAIAALADCEDPVDFKKVRKRDPELDDFVWGTICTPRQFVSTDGKRRATNCASSLDTIIQTII